MIARLSVGIDEHAFDDLAVRPEDLHRDVLAGRAAVLNDPRHDALEDDLSEPPRSLKCGGRFDNDAVVAPNERLKRADWKTLTATPGRICLECSRQFDPADVPVERDGLLDDPRYIEGLPADHYLRARENVFAFSANIASLETLQLLAMVVAPHGISNPGVQTYHFVSGNLDQDVLTCAASRRYSTVHCARGDRVEPGIADLHDAAEEARERRRPSQLPRRRWRRLRGLVRR
jgi:molybdopterin-synthase adenylyltransferase